MKARLITVILLALMGSLSGCGQKGPLYRDAPAQTSASEKTFSASEESDGTDNDADNR